ncbi:hypothetical protein CS542_08120 [Pedobacter sp. IW39]|nr:hypothetical protein CS542_08120 [Pedobacter sp. IW39]
MRLLYASRRELHADYLCHMPGRVRFTGGRSVWFETGLRLVQKRALMAAVHLVVECAVLGHKVEAVQQMLDRGWWSTDIDVKYQYTYLH